MTVDPIAMARQAAERLQGSSGTIAGLGEEFEALESDAAFCAELDQLVFCCEQCNWWFEQSDMATLDDTDEWICEECANER